jgi:aspartate/methionine/tyrosine aminotransferase
MMRTPYGQPADHIEKVMLLAMWANYLSQQKSNSTELKNKFILAGLGNPTYPINRYIVSAFKKYWEGMESAVEQWHSCPELENDHSAIGYGDPYGDAQAKIHMAQAMSGWYDSEISPKNVLFTVGGISGLKIIFEVFNSFYAVHNKYRVITPFPHYSAYANNSHHILHPIDVMAEKGYKLTAASLEKSITQAFNLAVEDGIPPKAILICNPSNPLGTCLQEEELKKIAEVLRKYPNLHIILDEAYAEMSFTRMPSFLQTAPDLKSRTILLRSATKALSSAGERMAIILAFDDYLINELVKQQVTSYIHAPRSAQIAYAEAMLHYGDEERKIMAAFYQKKINYVNQRLSEMGAAMPCADHQVEAGFYALGDFSDVFGMEMPKGIDAALGNIGIAQTGEDLAYYFLFKDSLMIAPLSYFGLAIDCGYLRITCSGRMVELKEMMDRLERRLFEARLKVNTFLIHEILSKMEELTDSHLHKTMFVELHLMQSFAPSCSEIKQQNNSMMRLLMQLTKSSVSNELAI